MEARMSPERWISEAKIIESYLKEINRVPLLTAEEEKELAARIQRDGDVEAFHRLVKANLRFVVNIAKKYKRSGISLLDLINEGNIGLIRAAKKYDPSMGLRFTSYAIWWIRYYLSLYLARHGGVFSIPVKQYSVISQIENAYQRLYQRYKREPTPEELGRELEMDAREVCMLGKALAPYSSLKRYLEKEEGGESPGRHSPYELSPVELHFHYITLREKISRILARMKPREAAAIKLYFGLEGHLPSRSYAELGRRMNLSREGARMLFHRAMEHFRELAGPDLLDESDA